MAFVFCLQTEKGGVGKSTITINLTAAFAQIGYKTLIADADSQGNTSEVFLPDGFEYGMHNVFANDHDDSVPYVVSTDHDRLYIIPSDDRLRSFDRTANFADQDTFLLRDSLAEIADLFEIDVVIIDTPPRSHFSTYSSLLAANMVVVPVQPERFSATSVMKFQHRLIEARKENPSLMIRYVPNLVDKAWPLHRDTVASLRRTFGDLVLDSVLHRYTSIPNAFVADKPITSYAPKSPAVAEICAVAEELIAILSQSVEDKHNEPVAA